MAYQTTTPVSDQVGIFHSGSIPLRVQRAAISLTTSGATTIVAAPQSTHKIVVLSMMFSLSGTAGTKFNFQSHTTTGQASGFWYAINDTTIWPHNPGGWFECVPGEALDIASNASVVAGGTLLYVLVPVSQWEA